MPDRDLPTPATELHGIRTANARMRWQLELVRRFARVDAPVLVYGETGTGKELVARALHKASRRANRSLVIVDCAALPESLVESELFGHDRGAFTGADCDYGGRIESAAGGTLFLDEANSLSPAVQGKLLRFLEQREFCRVGRQRPITVDLRLVVASNVPLEKLVADGRMRADFYHRVNVLRIDLPPLRERVEDVVLLARHFVAEDPVAQERGIVDVSAELLAQLAARSWPGNVRELRNTLRRAIALSAGGPVLDHLDAPASEEAVAPSPAASGASPEPVRGFRSWIREREREYLLALLDRYGSASQQAAASGLPPRTLYRKLKDLGLSANLLPVVVGQPIAAVTPRRRFAF
jgi:DNA-binding NtrC family response regulator